MRYRALLYKAHRLLLSERISLITKIYFHILAAKLYIWGRETPQPAQGAISVPSKPTHSVFRKILVPFMPEHAILTPRRHLPKSAQVITRFLTHAFQLLFGSGLQPGRRATHLRLKRGAASLANSALQQKQPQHPTPALSPPLSLNLSLCRQHLQTGQADPAGAGMSEPGCTPAGPLQCRS